MGGQDPIDAGQQRLGSGVEQLCVAAQPVTSKSLPPRTSRVMQSRALLGWIWVAFQGGGHIRSFAFWGFLGGGATQLLALQLGTVASLCGQNVFVLAVHRWGALRTPEVPIPSPTAFCPKQPPQSPEILVQPYMSGFALT